MQMIHQVGAPILTEKQYWVRYESSVGQAVRLERSIRDLHRIAWTSDTQAGDDWQGDQNDLEAFAEQVRVCREQAEVLAEELHELAAYEFCCDIPAPRSAEFVVATLRNALLFFPWLSEKLEVAPPPPWIQADLPETFDMMLSLLNQSWEGRQCWTN